MARSKTSTAKAPARRAGADDVPWAKHLKQKPLPRALRLQYAVLDSGVLGERIVVVIDPRVALPAELADLVRYDGAEIEALREDHPTATELRTVHAAKRIFPGARILLRRAV